MKTVRVFIITAFVIGSLFFLGNSVSAQTSKKLPVGWGRPKLVQVGPRGQSVSPLREIIRRDNALMRNEIKNARETGGDIGAVARNAVQRLINDIRNFLGM
jgi:hypothetical protein